MSEEYRDSRRQEDDPDFVRVQQACRVLSEHFDAVQIFASRHEPATHEGTIHISYGLGNWYARYGLVRSWCAKQDSTP